MKVIKILAMVVVLASIASCGVLKNKSKNSQKLEIKESAKVEASVNESTGSKKSIKETEIDKGTIVTERETTTKTTREGKKGKIVISKGDLKPGENFLRDSAGQMVKAVLDTLNKTLTLGFDIPGESTETNIKEKITESKDVEKKHEEETQDTSKKQVAVQAQQNRTEVQLVSHSESKPNVWAILMNNIGWAIGFLIILVGVCWWFFGYRKK